MYNRLTYKYQVKEDGLVFNVELPGKSKEDVKIYNEDYILRNKYDFDNVKAKMKNGLLTITVPQIKKTEKQIQIE